MPLFYGHHPEEEVANPGQIDAELADRYTKTEADTLTQEASANAEKQAQTYSDSGDAATLASAQTYSEEASANALSQAQTYSDSPTGFNGWVIENFTMTTTTTAASGRPLNLIMQDDHALFLKLHVVSLEFDAPSGDSGAWHYEALYSKGTSGESTTLIGSIAVLFEEKTNPDWDVDIILEGPDNTEIVIYVVGKEAVNGGFLGQYVRWKVTAEWLLRDSFFDLGP